MHRDLRTAVVAAILAIAITTAMDATGYTQFSALPLCPLFLCFWYGLRLSRREIGFQLGRLTDFSIAVLYPVIVIAAIAAVAYAAGAVHFKAEIAAKATKQLLAMSTIGTLAVLLTEEGFFRGLLWGAFSRAGCSRRAVLSWTALIFVAWHLSAVLLPTGFDPPLRQVPVFLLNALLLGLNWGLLRQRSGSIVVSALSHAVWNAGAYTLFGFGTKTGLLGITDAGVWGPEVGVAGVAGNFAAFWLLTRWSSRA